MLNAKSSLFSSIEYHYLHFIFFFGVLFLKFYYILFEQPNTYPILFSLIFFNRNETGFLYK